MGLLTLAGEIYDSTHVLSMSLLQDSLTYLMVKLSFSTLSPTVTGLGYPPPFFQPQNFIVKMASGKKKYFAIQYPIVF